MKQYFVTVAAFAITGLLLPIESVGQTFSGEVHSLQSVLDNLYNDMMPLCGNLIGVGQGLAGFAALWYISARVWRSIANAEPVDFYPLLRPFALGLAIAFFPALIRFMNGVLGPTVTGTAAMMKESNNAIEYLLRKREEAIQKTELWQIYGDDGTHGKWYRYENPDGGDEDPNLISNGLRFLMAKTAYGFRNAIKQWLSEILHLVYEAAALCINTLRTFYLLVLCILGPLVFGLAVFDGLQHTLTVWIARYVNIFLWLPVANIFGSIIAKVQENMLRIDLAQIEKYGDTFFSASDTAYLVFLIIGIIGYFTVPSVANYIVHAGGSNVLLYKVSSAFSSTVASTASSFGTATQMVSSHFRGGEKPGAEESKSTDDKFMRNKISGEK